MKKVPTDIEGFAAKIADKQDNPTLHELAKVFPEKTYRELEKYRDEDRHQEANKIPLTEAQQNLVDHLTESQQKQEELEPITKGVCVTGALRKDRSEINWKIKAKDLEEGLANSLEINEAHQKLNGKLQERVTELEEENKKLHNHVEKQILGARKAGM